MDNFDCACIAACKDNYIEFTSSIPSTKLNPEKMVIKQDVFNKLSVNAKEAIEIILNDSVETTKIYKSKTPSKERIKIHLRKVWKYKDQTTYLVQDVLKELEEFVETF